MKKNRDVNKDTIKIISDYGCDEANSNGPTKQRSLWVSFPCISAIKVTQRFYDIIIKMQSRTLYCVIGCLNIAFSLKTNCLLPV